MRRVYKNSALNIGAQILVMLVMFFSMPWIVKGLGDVSFAILSLVWAVVAYFTLWDLGIGRAVTKFVAEKRVAGKGEDVADVVRISVMISLGIGILFGILILLFRSELEKLLFTVPPGYAAVVRLAIAIVAVSMPVLILQGVFRGVLMGFDRFDLSNSVQVLNGILQWVGALVLVLLHVGVLWVIGFVMLTRAFTMIIVLTMSFRLVKWLSFRRWPRFLLFKDIIGFGGWAMVSQVISPVLQYSERFMLSALVATGIVTYYVVPYEATSKMLVIAVGIVTALFPEMSGLHGRLGLEESLKELYGQSERLLLFVFLPLGAVLVSFAPEILRIWMGNEFAGQGADVFRVLSVAFVFSAISQLPFTTLQAVGRSDLTGKYHLVQLPLYLLFAFWAIHAYGLIGAGVATLVRTLCDMTLLYFITWHALGLKADFFSNIVRTVVIPLTSLSVGISAALVFSGDLIVKVVCMLSSLCIYPFVLYQFSLSEREKLVVDRLVIRKR